MIPDLNFNVTVSHCIRAGYCIRRGVKPWCESNGLDFRKFVREGISAEKFWATGDARARRVVRLAATTRGTNGR